MVTPIDIYCERTGPEFWSEPLNAFTNLAFIAAGLAGLVEARRHGAGRLVEILAWWVGAIGVGSFLFHTIANRLTMWLDILPIAVFTLAYTAFAIRRYLGFGRLPTTAIFLAYYAGAAMLTMSVPEQVREATAGSTAYLPAFLALFVFGTWASIRNHPAGRWLLAGAFLFALSVTFRALDPHVCDALPFGTHFLWHVLNGAMLCLLLIAAARHGGQKAVTYGWGWRRSRARLP
ncbi:MAG: ceramidase [Rhizobiaceae bacterium]|nr:ceramidase [Rhizobiaceae bacterium]MCV0404647.1 ceramidase [Rhizobiaceae bacterium]